MQDALEAVSPIPRCMIRSSTSLMSSDEVTAIAIRLSAFNCEVRSLIAPAMRLKAPASAPISPARAVGAPGERPDLAPGGAGRPRVLVPLGQGARSLGERVQWQGELAAYP